MSPSVHDKHLTRLFHKACADYSLISDGDHILIGLSGGKDSLALVELLGRRAQIYIPRFRVTAVHVRVRERNYLSDLSYLEQFCATYQVPFVVRDVEIGEERDGKDPCFLCSWYRRKTLFETAAELGCNKIALGHHRDDILRTALMNLTFQGRFDTIYPKLPLDKMPITMIRPLCLISEADLIEHAQLHEYQKQPKLCPFEHATSRTEIERVVDAMRQLNPEAMDSLWGAISKTFT